MKLLVVGILVSAGLGHILLKIVPAHIYWHSRASFEDDQQKLLAKKVANRAEAKVSCGS
jgi:hypothetical protein